MLSQGSIAPAAKWPRARAFLAGLAVLAVLLVAGTRGGGLTQAAAAPAPQPEQPKKDEPKKDEAKPRPGTSQEDLSEIDRILQGSVSPNLPPEQQEYIRQQMRRMIEMSRLMAPQQFPGGLRPFVPLGQQEPGRLGVRVAKPGATLVEQLDLPRGQGLVVEAVAPDSAAAKAGLKPHDILLEFDGKPVPDAAPELAKQLEGIKADTPVDAVVLRKGKRETVKGIVLPEAAAVQGPLPGGNVPGAFPLQRPALAPQAFSDQGGLPLAGANGVLTTSFRAGDRVTTRHQEGSLVITVTGTIAEGKMKVTEIRVQDGNTNEKYDGVDKVAEAYRDKVKNLVEMSEKSAKITIQP